MAAYSDLVQGIDIAVNGVMGGILGAIQAANPPPPSPPPQPAPNYTPMILLGGGLILVLLLTRDK